MINILFLMSEARKSKRGHLHGDDKASKILFLDSYRKGNALFVCFFHWPSSILLIQCKSVRQRTAVVASAVAGKMGK